LHKLHITVDISALPLVTCFSYNRYLLYRTFGEAENEGKMFWWSYKMRRLPS